MLSGTVSKLSLNIGRIFAANRGVPLRSALALVPGEPCTTKIWCQETRNIVLLYGAKNCDILNV